MSSAQSGPNDTRLVSLADEKKVEEILGETVLGLWRIVNTLTRLRPSKRERYRVAIFGSARAQPGTFAYEEVKRVAAAFAAMGCDIVTGGGPGLMQAANEGASRADPRRSALVDWHPGRAAVRAGRQPVRRAGLRPPHVLHAPHAFRPRGCRTPSSSHVAASVRRSRR